jgi:hypothetical protein
MIPSAAYAAGVTKHDPAGDAPRRLDITTTTYLNAPNRVGTRITVPALVRGGSAVLFITSAAPSDTAYRAILRIRPDGSLRKRLVHQGSLGDTETGCRFKGVWNAADNYIEISVPRPCIPSVGGGSLFLRAITGGNKDYAPPARNLPRG